MLVGERPGDVEVKKLEPFAGRSGVVIDKLIRRYGLQRVHCTTSNATLCTQKHFLKEGEWNAAIGACSGRLRWDIERAKQPDRKLLVLLFGRKALRAVSGFDSIIGKKGRRGYPVVGKGLFADLAPSLHSEIIFFPVVHPSAVLRDPALLPVWKTDIERALLYAQDQIVLWKWKPIYTGFTNDVYERLLSLAYSRVPRKFGCDVETAGKEPLIAPLICTGLATPEWAICFPHGKEPDFDQALQKTLGNPEHTIVTQNGNHDWQSLETHGYILKVQQEDILLKARVRYPQLDHDLMSLTSYHRFIEKWKINYHEGKSEDWMEVPTGQKLDEMMEYCAKDAWATQDALQFLDEMMGDEA